MKSIFTKAYVFAIILAIAACQHKKNILSDVSITKQSAFNNLFLDSSQLQQIINENNDLSLYRKQFFDFYRHRNFQFAWFDTTGLSEQADNFYNLQSNYIANLQDSTLFNAELEKNYHTSKEKGRASGSSDSLIVKTEVLLTGQFFRYAAKVYQGSGIDATELGWFLPRKKINLALALDSLVNAKGKTNIEPLNSQYRQLEKYLVQYLTLQQQPWKIIATNKVLKKGDSSRTVAMIKKRLFALGDLSDNDTTQKFDKKLLQAVKQFQKRMGLPSNGIISKPTMKEINRPIDSLIEKLLVNMERARWMLPDTAKTDYIIVNIPEYKLYTYDSGAYSFSMNVVVGTAANSTVIFNGNIRYIVFSPYWNVTDDIVKKEVLPAIKKDKNYLVKNNMEIVKYVGKTPVIRQKPGPNNSLGGVKFLFPNSYNIYLHDTPFKEGFSASKRSFSHGCIRLGEPIKLAHFLLRRDTLFTPDSIKRLMHQPKEKWITANPKVPVTIKYFTAWVDTAGLLNFREDIYGHDKKMAEKLFAKPIAKKQEVLFSKPMKLPLQKRKKNGSSKPA